MEGVWHVLEVKTPLLPSQVVQLEKGRAREFSLRSPCKRLTVVHRPSLKGEPYGVECMHERVSGHFSEYRDISDFFRGSRLVRIRVGGGSHATVRAAAPSSYQSAIAHRARIMNYIYKNYGRKALSYRVPPCTLPFLPLGVRVLALYEPRRKLSLLFPLPQSLHGCLVSLFLYFLELSPLQSSVLPSIASSAYILRNWSYTPRARASPCTDIRE